MEFLKAKSVRLRSHFRNKLLDIPLYTTTYAEQKLYVAMSETNGANKVELVIAFDKEHPAPKKVSLSANQYTMTPFEVEITMYKRYARIPYEKIKMQGLRTLFSIKENTGKIVLEFKKPDAVELVADVKLNVNYIEF